MELEVVLNEWTGMVLFGRNVHVAVFNCQQLGFDYARVEYSDIWNLHVLDIIRVACQVHQRTKFKPWEAEDLSILCKESIADRQVKLLEILCIADNSWEKFECTNINLVDLLYNVASCIEE